MSDRPILFSGPMVRALLAGTKTQTRRALRDQNPVDLCASTHGAHLVRREVHDHGKLVGHRMAPVNCPYGVPGDRLWVRETFATRQDCKDGSDKAKHYLRYRANGDDLSMEWHSYDKWRPSIFMPRWASRITLEVTEVRVQRLGQLSEDDAKAEGMLFNGTYYQGGPHAVSGSKVFALATQAYRDLWDSLNAKRAPWASNPWVWALTFKVIPASPTERVAGR